MFKNILRIQVEEAFPVHVKGRPRLLGFDDARWTGEGDQDTFAGQDSQTASTENDL